MASRLDDLIRAHAERLDQLASPIDLTEVTSAPNDTTTVALIDIEPPWIQPERGRSRWPIIATAAAVVAVIGVTAITLVINNTNTDVDEPPPPTAVATAPTTRVAPKPACCTRDQDCSFRRDLCGHSGDVHGAG